MLMMDWEQKLYALNKLTEHSLIMRRPGDWWVCSELMERSITSLTGVWGEGATPVEAVESHWFVFVTGLPSTSKIWVPNLEAHYRWDEFMWKEIKKDKE